MAQVTESLIAEFMRHIEAKRMPPITLNEMEQLCYAWRKSRCNCGPPPWGHNTDCPAGETSEHR